MGMCQWADTKSKRAHLSEVTALPLSPSHSLVMPSTVYVPSACMLTPQSSLLAKLSREGGVSMGADTKANTALGRWLTPGW